MRVLLVGLLLAACDNQLVMYTGLSEREANLMISALDASGIRYSKVREREGGVTVMVETTRFGEAVALLNAKGLPQQDFKSVDEVFGEGGLIPTPAAERARLTQVYNEELAKTISQIDGVLTARVHVVLPESDALGRNATPSSASIFIRRDANFGIDGFRSQLKNLLTHSIVGLSYEQVSIIDIPVEVSSVIDASAAKSALARKSMWPQSLDLISGFAGALLALLLGGGAAAIYFVRRRKEAAKDSGESEVAATAHSTTQVVPLAAQRRTGGAT